MKISKRCDYALRSMIYLCAKDLSAKESTESTKEESTPVGVSEIAQKQDIPIKFLSSILFQLKNAGYVSSKRGPGGGYYLKCNPEKVHVEHIVKLVDNKKANHYFINFSRNATFDSVSSSQVVKEFIDEIERQTKKIMRKFTLRKLAARYIYLHEENS